jgi:hypothetical protein
MDSKNNIAKKGKWFVALAILILTVLVYLPVIQNDFVNWDDPEYVYENRNIQVLGLQSLKWMLTTFHAANWHPVTWFSHALDHALWGLNPMGHHLTSILLHGLNAFLVVILIMRLLHHGKSVNYRFAGYEKENQLNRDSLIIAGVTGLFFGLHPIHVESVAWVSERKDVLYAFFYLLSIVLYIEYVSSRQGKKILYFGLSLGFFILSLMSKPMAVTLPVVLIILDFYPLERLSLKNVFTSQRKIILEKLVFFGLSAVSSILTIQAQKSAGAIKPYFSIQFTERLLVAIRAPVFYLYKMLWPTDLAPLYPYPSGISFFRIEYIISFSVLFMITGFCIYSWKRQKIWTVVWAYYLITLFPVLGIIKVGDQAAADRYMYLPRDWGYQSWSGRFSGKGIKQLLRWYL